MNKSLITYNNVKSIVERKYGTFYTANYDINDIGIRTKTTLPNVFDDFRLQLYTNSKGSNIDIYEGTTDPGTFWLQNPMNVNGCAILVPNRYPSCWTFGLHSGYDALVQCGNMSVYRDTNKDGVLNFDPATIQTGMFGIDSHRANKDMKSVNVNKWSAGCQVIASPVDFAIYLATAKKQKESGHGSKFTYILLEESDFE